jgi:hypothetical protein
LSSDTELAVPTVSEMDMGRIVKNAVGQAEILKKAIVEQGLSTRIQGREHINVEGWQLVLALNNTVPVIKSSGRIVNSEGEIVGYEAECELRDGNLVVGSGYGMCTRDERTWAKRDDYALRSMAETRAIGKACRNRFGFLAKIAEFEATPQEEMQAAMSPEQHAKYAVFDIAGQDAKAAGKLYRAALEELEITSPKTDEEAEAIVAHVVAAVAPFEEE